MTISSEIRKQLLSSFRIELQEHVQTMTDGLLILEKQSAAGTGPGDESAEIARQELLNDVLRAAHSLKGAARAVEVTQVSELAHALEDALDLLRQQAVAPTSTFFTACYQTLDAIQIAQGAFESGAAAPDISSVLAPLVQLRGDAGVDEERKVRVPVRQKIAAPVGSSLQAPSPVPGVCNAPSPGDHTPGVARGADEAPAALLPGDGDTIRVQVSKLDALMAQLSELLLTKIRIEQRLTQLQGIEDRLTGWQADWQDLQLTVNQITRQRQHGGGHQQGLDRLLDHLSTNQEQLREVSTSMSALSRDYANDTLQMSLVVDELEEDIKRVRMLPLSTILRPFGRMVRDLAQEAGKAVVLQIKGAETELDKRVLEQIKDPLIHLLRNAVDHGIEVPETRVAAGKPPHGTITLTAEQFGQDVLIRIADDGRGLDLRALRRVISHRLGTDPDTLTQSELEQAIYTAGISTSSVITDVSGRGVGLDIVRRNVEDLHGRIDMVWAPGAGMEFLLTLPLALSSTHGLLVSAGGLRFAIPLSAIVRIMPLDMGQVTEVGGNPALTYQQDPIPIVRLSDVLSLSQRTSRGTDQGGAVVVLASAERRMAFIVDDLEGEQEIVNKGLGRQLRRVGGLAGATVLGSGEILLVLNIGDLIKMALRTERRSIVVEAEGAVAATAHVRRRLLIVDDSITTRTLEKNILEAAGYLVDIATNGQEAWDIIASGELPDLVVSDVSMPRMDGIQLTTRIKSEARTSLLPVILVTSLDSPQDKARGIEAGADAYITKGSFDQNGLLSTVRQLI